MATGTECISGFVWKTHACPCSNPLFNKASLLSRCRGLYVYTAARRLLKPGYDDSPLRPSDPGLYLPGPPNKGIGRSAG